MKQLSSTASVLTWLLLITLVAAYLVSRQVGGVLFDTNIRAFASAESDIPFAGEALADSEAAFSRRLVVHAGPASAAQLGRFQDQISSALSDIADNELAMVSASPTEPEVFKRLARYQRLSSVRLSELAGMSNAQLQAATWSSLVRPGADRLDPLNLVPEPMTNSFDGWEPANGGLIRRSAGGARMLQVYQLRGNAFDSRVQDQLQRSLGTVEPSGIPVNFYGAAFHASEAASAAKAEASVLGTVSALGLIALAVVAFRSAMPLLALLVTITAAVLSGAGAVAFFFGQIHVLALLLGTAVIGMSADYALHLICDRFELSANVERDSAAVVARGVLVAAGTTVAAYSLLLGAEPALLSQLAVFAIVGLIAAVVTVMTISNRIVGGWKPSHSAAVVPHGFLRSRFTTVLVLLTIFCGGAGVVIYASSDNDPRQFVDLPVADSRHSDRLDDSRFLLFSAHSGEQLLSRGEQLANKLDGLIEAGKLAAWSGINQSLPSHDTQRANIETLKQRLLGEQGLDSLAVVGLSSRWIESEKDALLAATPLGIDDLPPSLRKGRFWHRPAACTETCFASSVRLVGVVDAVALQELARDYEWLSWIDPVASSKSALDSVQQSLLGRIIIGFIVVLALLSLRYRQGAIGVLKIPLAATVLALVLAVAFGQPITLFHCAASLVGFGLALDYGVFTHETPAQATLLAIVLSALTTMLAFGLLALSSTPAVAWFGQTVAASVAVSALLAVGLARIEDV